MKLLDATSKNSRTIAKRINQLIKVISQGVYEKEHIFRLTMLALLAGESIFLLGKPGIAKSLIARRIKYAFYQSRNFEYLMNRFSTPEEIFGPISINDLLKGHYIRLIDGYLPTADIAFLDEIWKAGPSIQNTLLTIINEKLFRNGNEDLKVPLKLLISASNELPETGKGLEALFDRFIIRMIVSGLNQISHFNHMLQSTTSLEIDVPNDLQIKPAEYQTWIQSIESVRLNQTSLDFIQNFRFTLSEATENQAYISDRRWKKIAKLIKASAFYEGRKQTEDLDLLVIPYCIWDNEIEAENYQKLFNEAFINHIVSQHYDLRAELIAKIEDLSHQLTNQQAINTFAIEPSIYQDVFKQQAKGTFHRLMWQDRNFPIAFIKTKDYEKLVKKMRKTQSVAVYYGTSLNQLHKVSNFILAAKDQQTIYDNEEKQTYQLEMQDLNPATIDYETIKAEITQYQLQLDQIVNQSDKIMHKIKNQTSLFFEHDYQLLKPLILEIFAEKQQNGITTETALNLHPDTNQIQTTNKSI